MLHIWLMTCWKWWIFTFLAEYWNSTLGHSSIKFFLDPITFSGCQVISQLLTIKKIKPKKSPICVHSLWKKMCGIAHIGNTSAKTILFFIYSIRTWTRTKTRARTWSQARSRELSGMATSTASETTTDTDTNKVTNLETHIDTDKETGNAWTDPRRMYSQSCRQWHVQIYGHDHSHGHWTCSSSSSSLFK